MKLRCLYRNLLVAIADQWRRPGLSAIAGNIGWLSFDKVIRLLVGLAVGVWLARYLGPDQYGQFQFALAFVSLFSVTISLGLSGIIVREIARSDARTPDLIATAFAMQGVWSLFLWSMMVGVAALLLDDDGVSVAMVTVLGGCFLFKTSDVVKCWFEAKLRLKYVIWVENAALFLISTAKVWLILVGAPLMAFVWATLLEAALVAAGLAWIYIRRGPPRSGLQARLDTATALLSESWPIVLANIAVASHLRIDHIMLGSMLDNHQVGIYAAAVRVIEAFYFLPAAIAASIVPALVGARDNSRETYHAIIQRTLSLSFVASIVLTVPLFMLATPIMHALFGAAYQDAGDILRLYALALPFVFLGAPAGKWFLVEGRQIDAMYRVLSGLALNIVLNTILIPRHGAVGAAVSTVAALIMSNFAFNAIYPPTRRIFVMQCRAMLPWKGWGAAGHDDHIQRTTPPSE